MCLVYPGIAQMVERVVWDHEAADSRPATRTIKILTAIFIDYNTDDIRFTNILSILFNIAESYSGLYVRL